MLCDVRRNPVSRKPGFSRKALASSCDAIGIRYVHMPELGIASDKRRTLSTEADYDALFAEYEAAWLPLQGTSLDTIRGWRSSSSAMHLSMVPLPSTISWISCIGRPTRAVKSSRDIPRSSIIEMMVSPGGQAKYAEDTAHRKRVLCLPEDALCFISDALHGVLKPSQ